MMHAILKPRISRASIFRVQWTLITYACREANGSLKPVPVGLTREQLYCGQCKAKKCLFTGKKPRSLEERRRREAEERALAQEEYLKDKARKRGLGLNTGGQPLQQNCWNCCELRIKLGGYVCRHEPETTPVSMRKMVNRYAENCQGFCWRLKVEIPPLNGDGTDCDPL
jgi:hypothetical protein